MSTSGKWELTSDLPKSLKALPEVGLSAMGIEFKSEVVPGFPVVLQ